MAGRSKDDYSVTTRNGGFVVVTLEFRGMRVFMCTCKVPVGTDGPKRQMVKIPKHLASLAQERLRQHGPFRTSADLAQFVAEGGRIHPPSPGDPEGD